jgi:hypothetical protein
MLNRCKIKKLFKKDAEGKPYDIRLSGSSTKAFSWRMKKNVTFKYSRFQANIRTLDKQTCPCASHKDLFFQKSELHDEMSGFNLSQAERQARHRYVQKIILSILQFFSRKFVKLLNRHKI